jgi:hypothetical protein
MVPEKLRAIYAWRATQAILTACIPLADKVACITSSVVFSIAAPLLQHSHGC